MFAGSLGSQKEWGCLRAAEFLWIGVGKPAAISEPRCGLSAQCYHKLQTLAGSGDHSLSRGSETGRTAVRTFSFPWEEWCAPQDTAEFGDSDNTGVHCRRLQIWRFETVLRALEKSSCSQAG